MKKLILSLLFVPSLLFADVRHYAYDDPQLNSEVDNVYHDLLYLKAINITASTATITQLNVSSVTLQGRFTVNGSTITGKVVQVTQGLRTGQDTTPSATFVNTSLSVIVTPRSASNNILLLASGELISETNNLSKATLANNTTNLVGSQGICQVLYSGISAVLEVPCAMAYLDSPATTSAITYRVRFASDGINNADWGNTNVTSTLIAVEIQP